MQINNLVYRNKKRGAAICIGTDKYDCDKITDLDNAVNDARAIAEKLCELNFEVFEVYDKTGLEFDNTFQEFKKSLKQYDICIFYFAGHGLEHKGKNYLLAKNSVINDNDEFLPRQSLNLQDLIDEISETQCPTSIIIIDACRKEPYKINDRGGSIGFDFAPLDLPKGSLIAFSTSPGKGANEDSEAYKGHSIFTGSLLHHLDEKGLEIEQLFKKVRTEVHNLTRGNQTPWEHTSLIGQFIINPGIEILAHSLPYSENAIKDYYWDSDELKEIIRGFKFANWPTQKKALEDFSKYNGKISPDALFVIGRNITQMFQGECFAACDFVKDPANLAKFTDNKGENHLVNGILFEIYFNSKGEYRYCQFKSRILEQIMKFHDMPALKRSFEFIENVLKPYSSNMLFVPSPTPKPTELYAVILERKLETDVWEEEPSLVIDQIKYYNTQLLTDDINNQIRSGDSSFGSVNELKKKISELYHIPIDYLNLTLNKDTFPEKYIYLDKLKFKQRL